MIIASAGFLDIHDYAAGVYPAVLRSINAAKTAKPSSIDKFERRRLGTNPVNIPGLFLALEAACPK
jgi:hypothetical protein